MKCHPEAAFFAAEGSMQPAAGTLPQIAPVLRLDDKTLGVYQTPTQYPPASTDEP